MNQKKYIAYYRVSTDRQGRSGLGLEAQQQAVRSFLHGRGELIESFVEVESGKRNNRPEISAALDACRQYKAVLLIAKLDRLSRNVFFISGLLESGVEFIAVDMPEANRLTIHILAAVAEHERAIISQRTIEALQAAKARGTKLGCPSPKVGGKVRGKQMANERGKREQKIAPHIDEIRNSGITSLRAIALALNERGISTWHNRKWYATTVRNFLLQYEDSSNV